MQKHLKNYDICENVVIIFSSSNNNKVVIIIVVVNNNTVVIITKWLTGTCTQNYNLTSEWELFIVTEYQSKMATVHWSERNSHHCYRRGVFKAADMSFNIGSLEWGFLDLKKNKKQKQIDPVVITFENSAIQTEIISNAQNANCVSDVDLICLICPSNMLWFGAFFFSISYPRNWGFC